MRHLIIALVFISFIACRSKQEPPSVYVLPATVIDTPQFLPGGDINMHVPITELLIAGDGHTKGKVYQYPSDTEYTYHTHSRGDTNIIWPPCKDSHVIDIGPYGTGIDLSPYMRDTLIWGYLDSPYHYKEDNAYWRRAEYWIWSLDSLRKYWYQPWDTMWLRDTLPNFGRTSGWEVYNEKEEGFSARPNNMRVATPVKHKRHSDLLQWPDGEWYCFECGRHLRNGQVRRIQKRCPHDWYNKGEWLSSEPTLADLVPLKAYTVEVCIKCMKQRPLQIFEKRVRDTVPLQRLYLNQ